MHENNALQPNRLLPCFLASFLFASASALLQRSLVACGHPVCLPLLFLVLVTLMNPPTTNSQQPTSVNNRGPIMHMPDGSCDSWKEPHSQIMPRLGHFSSRYYIVRIRTCMLVRVLWLGCALPCLVPIHRHSSMPPRHQPRGRGMPLALPYPRANSNLFWLWCLAN